MDLDLLQFKPGRQSSLGIRTGVEWFETGGPGGNGSRFLDYNVLVRSTLSGELLRFDSFLGYARHTALPQERNGERSWLFKYGVELRWKIAPGVFGVLVKANGTRSTGTAGVGLYVGWDH